MSYTEFVAVEAILSKSKKVLHMLAFDPAEQPQRRIPVIGKIGLGWDAQPSGASLR